MCCLLLVCAVLNTLHTVKHILNEEECRSVGKAWNLWDDELAVVIVVKGAVQETLGVLEDYERRQWYGRATGGIKSKLPMFRHQLVQTHFSTLLILPSIH